MQRRTASVHDRASARADAAHAGRSDSGIDANAANAAVPIHAVVDASQCSSERIAKGKQELRFRLARWKHPSEAIVHLAAPARLVCHYRIEHKMRDLLAARDSRPARLWIRPGPALIEVVQIGGEVSALALLPRSCPVDGAPTWMDERYGAMRPQRERRTLQCSWTMDDRVLDVGVTFETELSDVDAVARTRHALAHADAACRSRLSHCADASDGAGAVDLRISDCGRYSLSWATASGVEPVADANHPVCLPAG